MITTPSHSLEQVSNLSLFLQIMSDPNPSNPRAAPSDADPDSPRASRDRLSRRRMQRFFLIGDRDHSPPSCSDSDDDWYGEMLMMKMMRGDPCPRKGMWRPPRAVSPEPQEEEIVGADGLVDCGRVHSDARLFEAKEKVGRARSCVLGLRCLMIRIRVTLLR